MSKVKDLNKFVKAKQRTDADASRDGPQPLEIVNDITSIETNTQKITFTDEFVVTSPTAREVNVAPVKNKIQTKILTGNVISDGAISDITFANLIVGMWYEVTGQVRQIVQDPASDDNVSVNFINDGNTVGVANVLDKTVNLDAGGTYGVSFKFQATGTDLTPTAASATVNASIRGNSTLSQTYIQLEERNDLVETTDFTP